MESITSRDNRAIKEYVKLREFRAFREKQGMYVIESAKLVQEALQSGVIFEKVFVTQPSLTKHYAALQRLFDRTQDNAKTRQNLHDYRGFGAQNDSDRKRAGSVCRMQNA